MWWCHRNLTLWNVAPWDTRRKKTTSAWQALHWCKQFGVWLYQVLSSSIVESGWLCVHVWMQTLTHNLSCRPLLLIFTRPSNQPLPGFVQGKQSAPTDRLIQNGPCCTRIMDKQKGNCSDLVHKRFKNTGCVSGRRLPADVNNLMLCVEGLQPTHVATECYHTHTHTHTHTSSACSQENFGPQCIPHFCL